MPVGKTDPKAPVIFDMCPQYLEGKKKLIEAAEKREDKETAEKLKGGEAYIEKSEKTYGEKRDVTGDGLPENIEVTKYILKSCENPSPQTFYSCKLLSVTPPSESGRASLRKMDGTVISLADIVTLEDKNYVLLQLLSDQPDLFNEKCNANRDKFLVILISMDGLKKLKEKMDYSKATFETIADSLKIARLGGLTPASGKNALSDQPDYKELNAVIEKIFDDLYEPAITSGLEKAAQEFTEPKSKDK